jgi:hypothetical protein
MNPPILTAYFATQVATDLRGFLSLCEEALALATGENQVLSGGPEYQPADFSPRRKSLLSGLDAALAKLKSIRVAWLQTDPAERDRCEEVKSLFQAVQGTLMKVLLLDRENQQALLRRGLVPVQHLPAAAAQRPHFVSGLYRKHAAG